MTTGTIDVRIRVAAAGVLRRTRKTLGADALIFLRVDRRTRSLAHVASSGLERRAALLLEARPLRLGRSAAPTRTVVLADLRRHLRRGGSWEFASGARSAAVVPVRIPGFTGGSLVALWREPREAGPSDLALLGALGDALTALVAAAPASPADGRLGRLERMHAFYRLALTASASRVAPRDVAGRLLGEFCRSFGFTRAGIWLTGGDGRRAALLCSRGAVPQDKGGTEPDPRDWSFTARLMRRRQGVFRQRAGRPARPGSLAWSGVGALFGAPLRRQGRPVGFLLADRGGASFTMDAAELRLGNVLADLTAEILEGVLGRHLEAKRERQLVLLTKVSEEVNDEERLPVLLPRLTRLIHHAARCHGVVLALYEDRAREIAVAAVSGPGGRRFLPYRFPVRRHQPASCLGSRAFLLRRPVRIHDAQHLPATSLYWPEARSVLVIPVRSDVQVMGVLRLEALPRHHFDDGDVELYALLGEQIGNALRRSRVLADLLRRQDELRGLSVALEARLEDERRRIAAELHDRMAQSLTAARINLGMVQQSLPFSGDAAKRLLAETTGDLDRIIERTRAIAMDLRPLMLDELGLLPTLRWFAATFEQRTGIRVAVRTQLSDSAGRHEHAALLFRFVQESLAAVERRASARRILINVGAESAALRAVVWDDGVVDKSEPGRDREAELLAMRERVERVGGTLTVNARVGLGTRLVAEVETGAPPVRPRPPRRIGKETSFVAAEGGAA